MLSVFNILFLVVSSNVYVDIYYRTEWPSKDAARGKKEGQLRYKEIRVSKYNSL
jgi:hypothetical protein